MRGGDAFCSRRVERQIYLRTRHMRVLYDIAPVLPGHSLIVPKRHVEQLTELRPAELLDLFATLKRIVPVLDGLYGKGSNSYDLVAQVGPYSSRTISHVHIHVMPRSKNDRYHGSMGAEVPMGMRHARKLSDAEVKREVGRLRKEFATK
jgi:diadenosine tetraphosphate (Ap4A) HIT family hydrolase